MKSKEQILSAFKKNYKPCFLLAWLRFLSYDEMKKIDMLEPYDAAVLAKQVKTNKDWDNLVIEYNEKNLLCGLCILMRKLDNEILKENWVLASVYAHDVKKFLTILEDNEYKFDGSINPDKIISYYKNISKKYKIEF